MIDAKQKRGDSFKWLGVLACDPDPDFVDAQLEIAAVLRKSSGGIVVQPLTVTKGTRLTENGLFVIPFEISASYVQTATWPLGGLSFDVQVTYGPERISSRTIEINVTEDDT